MSKEKKGEYTYYDKKAGNSIYSRGKFKWIINQQVIISFSTKKKEIAKNHI